MNNPAAERTWRRKAARVAAVAAVPLALGNVFLAHAAGPGTTDLTLSAFEDANANGVWDDGEQPAPGVVLDLTPAGGGAVTSLVSDPVTGAATATLASGDFDVTTTPDGTYAYQVVSGTLGTALTGTYTLNDGATQEFLVGVTEHPDCAVDATRCADVTGQVFYDANTDGIMQPTENPAPGVTVNLMQASTTVATAVTTDAGFYELVAPPADYAVQVVAPSDRTIVSGPVDVTTGIGAVFTAARGATAIPVIGLSILPSDPPPTTGDITPPVITLLTHPDTSTTSTAATFTLSADEEATWEYALDGGQPTAFAGGQADLTNLNVGPHAIEFRGTDAAGNISDPLTFTWVIQVANPDLVVFVNGDVTISGAGFIPGEPVDLQLRPGNRVLTSVVATAAGLAQAAVALPADIAAGDYTLVLVGVDSAVEVSAALTVQDAVAPPVPPVTPEPVPTADPTAAPLVVVPTADPTSDPTADVTGAGPGTGTLPITGFEFATAGGLAAALLGAGIVAGIVVRHRRNAA